MKRRVTETIGRRCKRFQENQKAALLADDGDRVFFKQTKNYLSKQRPKPFNVMDVFPGKDERTTANELADHFNSISSEFSPLDHNRDIPTNPCQS